MMIHPRALAFGLPVLMLAGLMALAPASVAAAEQQEVGPAEKKLMAAEGLFSRRLYDLAAKEYAEFLQHYDDHEQATSATYGLAICRYRLKEYDKAAEHLQKVLSDGDFGRTDEALAVLGHCRLASGEADAALSAFEQTLDKHGDSRHAQHAAVGRLQALYRLERYEKCLEAADAFHKRFPDHRSAPVVQFLRALSHFALGEYEPAGETLQQFVETYPNSPYHFDAKLLLAQSLQQQGQAEKAVELLVDLRDAAPPARQPELTHSLATALYDAGKYDDAREMSKHVLKEYGDSPYAKPARFRLGLAQHASGSYDEARKTLQEVARQDEDRRLDARYWIAQCDIEQQRFDEAAKALAELASHTPPPANLPAVRFDHALCLARLGESKDAASAFAAWRKDYPKHRHAGEAAYRQASCLYEIGAYDESRKLAEAVAKGESAFARPAAALHAENLVMLQKYDQAARILQTLRQAEDIDEAQKQQYTYRLGQCAFFQEDFKRAAELLRSLSGDDDNRPHLPFYLGVAEFQQDRHEQAAGQLQRYLSDDDNAQPAKQREARFRLGRALLAIEKTDQAAQQFQALVDASTESTWQRHALYELARLREDAGQSDQATKLLTRLLQSQPPAELAAPAVHLAAWIAMDAGEWDQAANQFGRIVKDWPDHSLAADARYQRATALMEAGKTDQALTRFREYLE
ncbi:MAG: tetratricopeptide repeat protein, partial [Planctomycetota bacterium]